MDYRERSSEHSRRSSDVMEVLRAGAAAFGVPLDEKQVAQFERYQRELIDWNQRVNLTSIVDPEEIQRRHFVDSLSCLLAAPEVLLRSGARLIDVGSGAGLPGLPLKIARPALEVTLVDSRGKRVGFLEHLIGQLQLSDTRVLSERAEVLGQDPAHREQYDVVVARALGELPVVGELCLPLLRVGGVLIAPRRGDSELARAAAERAVSELGGGAILTVPVAIAGLDDGRELLVVKKVAPTPARFPRRPGIPAKRPLG